MAVLPHLQSNFYILICHEILSYSIFAHCPLYVLAWVISTNPSKVDLKELLSKKGVGRKETGRRKKREIKKREMTKVERKDAPP